MDVASAILSTYETHLPTLPRSSQRHFAQRMYRITGDAKYVPPNITAAKLLAKQLQRDFIGLSDDGYAVARSVEMLSKRELGAENYDDEARREKYRRRNEVLAKWPEHPFAVSLLSRLSQANAFGLLESAPFAGREIAFDYLADVDFESFLTDPEVISVYAAQVANVSAYLDELGIVDLRDRVGRAFSAVYPRDRHGDLPVLDFRNMLYGLTHFAIAGSGYYQRFLDEPGFGWILEELRASADRSLSDATADIQAEIGLCFALCGRLDDPVVTTTRDALVKAYDSSARMIPSEAGGTDIADGEHRNVLAIMLLTWPEVLHPGPRLDPWEPVQSKGNRRGKEVEKPRRGLMRKLGLR